MTGDAMREVEEIIERALHGDASDRELAALAVWRRAAPENERHYRRTQRLLEEARALRGEESVVPPRPSAAAIAETVRARQAKGFPARARRAAMRWVPWSVAAAAVLLAVMRPWTEAEQPGWAPTEVVTGATELATVKLPDGTVVRLAPSSRLQVDGDRTREVTLDGRAFFAVTNAAGQPFRVHTRDATAKVLGTRFELATDPGGVRLTVLEGRVALAAPENSVEVGAGEQSGVRHGAATPPTPIPSGDRAVEWLGKFLVFQATPLRDAAVEIERMYGVRVDVVEPALLDATITATFTDRPADDVVDIVCAVLNAQCTSRDGMVSIRRGVR